MGITTLYDERVQYGYVTQDYEIVCAFGSEEGHNAGMNIVEVLKDIIIVRYSVRRRVVMQRL